MENSKRKLVSDQVSALGRKPNVGAKDAKDPAANNKVAATARTAENNIGVVGHDDALKDDDLSGTLCLQYFNNSYNPYASSKSKG
ncbi:hypothetical protein SCA6_001888 [Theobroma cacao]